MTPEKQIRSLMESLHTQAEELQKLMEVIEVLGKNCDRRTIIGAFHDIFGSERVVSERLVVFSQIGLKFDDDSRLKSAYRVGPDGVSPVRNVEVQSRT